MRGCTSRGSSSGGVGCLVAVDVAAHRGVAATAAVGGGLCGGRHFAPNLAQGIDDLLGRFLERESGVKILRYPAVAEKDTQRHNWEPAPTPVESFREIAKPFV